VDERSIHDVKPADLAGYIQCHFFAGIGGWSRALRQAGWDDDRSIWTGSCPCQPFSQAGIQSGFTDPRHLWPVWDRLIKECKPARVVGEQVASKDGLKWLDLVSSDLETADYAFGAADLCSAGVGSPNIRQRLYFVAERLGDGLGEGLEGYGGDGDNPAGWTVTSGPVAATGAAGGVADCQEQCERAGLRDYQSTPFGRFQSTNHRTISRVADPTGVGSDGRRSSEEGYGSIQPERLRDDGGRPGPTNGIWADADWLSCRDAKWRPVEPGTFPLAHGVPARLGRLRGYGNAINPEVAAEFIRCIKPTKTEVILSMWRDHTVAEIARELGISAGTVQKVIERGPHPCPAA